MSNTVDEILLAIAPELGTIDISRRCLIAKTMAGQVGCVFGDQQDLAIAYLTAHTLTLSNRAASGYSQFGAVSSLKEGDLTIGFSNGGNSAGADPLLSTSYGQQFVALRQSFTFTAMTRMT